MVLARSQGGLLPSFWSSEGGESDSHTLPLDLKLPRTKLWTLFFQILTNSFDLLRPRGHKVCFRTLSHVLGVLFTSLFEWKFVFFYVVHLGFYVVLKV